MGAIRASQQGADGAIIKLPPLIMVLMQWCALAATCAAFVMNSGAMDEITIYDVSCTPGVWCCVTSWCRTENMNTKVNVWKVCGIGHYGHWTLWARCNFAGFGTLMVPAICNNFIGYHLSISAARLSFQIPSATAHAADCNSRTHPVVVVPFLLQGCHFRYH